MRMILDNAVIKGVGGLHNPVLRIDEVSESPIYIRCLFDSVVISIYDGEWFSKIFLSCLFKNCSFTSAKNQDIIIKMDPVGGNVIKD